MIIKFLLTWLILKPYWYFLKVFVRVQNHGNIPVPSGCSMYQMHLVTYEIEAIKPEDIVIKNWYGKVKKTVKGYKYNRDYVYFPALNYENAKRKADKIILNLNTLCSTKQESLQPQNQ